MITCAAYVVFGLMSGDVVFAIAMCWLAVGSALFHGYPTMLTDALDRSGMYAAMAYLALPHWSAAAPAAVVGFLLPGNVLVPAIGALFAGFIWRAWSALPVFALAYVIWNIGKRRWDDDGDPVTVPWYARYCHGAWHVLTAYGMWLMRVG